MICPLVLSVVLSSLIIIVSSSISHLIVINICLMYWGAPMLGPCIPIIIMSSSWIEPYVVSFFVSYNGLYFKFYFIWYEYCFPCFLLVSICIKYIFPAPHFQSVCIPWFELGLLKTAYIAVLFLYPFSQSLWRRQWHPTPVLLPGKSHGQRSLVSCSPWGR